MRRPSTRRERNVRTVSRSVFTVSWVSASSTVYPCVDASRSIACISVAKYGFATSEIAIPIERVPPVTSERAMASPV